ncbi:MAG: diacylglycerol/lipid kinase family protein [Anaerolineae bacterium]
MRTKLIVNPVSNKGETLARLPQITQSLRRAGVAFDLAQTEAPGQAIDLARQAAGDGYERVVAVGGDGTCNEMVNGLLPAAAQGHSAVLGIIPSGSGNDLAFALGIPEDIPGACSVLKNGAERRADVGRVTVDGASRYFANGVGLGLDAEVALDVHRHGLGRGFAMYLWSVLKITALGAWPYRAKFSFNGQQRRQAITLFSVGNGPRAAGGFMLTPNARLDDGLLDVVYARDVSKLTVLNLLPRVMKGTHIHHRAVTEATTGSIEISVAAGIPGHIDGEILCTSGKNFAFEIAPNALRVWA